MKAHIFTCLACASQLLAISLRQHLQQVEYRYCRLDLANSSHAVNRTSRLSTKGFVRFAHFPSQCLSFIHKQIIANVTCAHSLLSFSASSWSQQISATSTWLHGQGPVGKLRTNKKTDPLIFPANLPSHQQPHMSTKKGKGWPSGMIICSLTLCRS